MAAAAAAAIPAVNNTLIYIDGCILS